jgi:hypothetical protein
MNITEANVAFDLSMSAYETAIGHLRVMPNEGTLYCCFVNSPMAYQIKQKYSCEVVLVPNEIAKTVFCWAVTANDSMYYSCPTS